MEHKIIIKQCSPESAVAVGERMNFFKTQMKISSDCHNVSTLRCVHFIQQRIKRNLEALFKNTEYENSPAQICELAESGKRPKDLYLGSLKKFGRADGTAIYRKLKQSETSDKMCR